MSEALPWYDRNAADLAAKYEAIDSRRLHAWLVDLLPAAGARVLDIGAGTGRDAAWLAGQGLAVTAVEPSAGMRAQGAALHRGANIAWVEDSLPDLARVRAQGILYDFVLLSAVWMHVLPAERERAFDTILALTGSGGRIALTLRFGPPGAGRTMYPVSVDEVERLARPRMALIERCIDAPDQQGRPDVSWNCVALKRRESL